VYRPCGVARSGAQAGQDPHGRSIDGSSTAIFCSRRARRAVLLDLLELLEGGRADEAHLASVRIGLIRFARSMVPPVVAPAPTMVCISSMKRIGFGRLRSAAMHRLEALLEVAAEARARRAARRCRARRPRRPSGLGTSVGRSRWPGLRTMRVLPTPARRRTPGCSCGAAQDLERPLHLRGPARSPGRACPARARRYSEVRGRRPRGDRARWALVGAPARDAGDGRLRRPRPARAGSG
jgi:hypothetical protein